MKVALIVIVVLSFLLRIYGLNWDQGQHLHPDERFLSIVVTNVRLPSSLSQYLAPSISPMSPYNVGTDFYVYGTLPITLLKIFAVIFGVDHYETVNLLGRLMSAVVDTGSVIMVYLFALILARRHKLDLKIAPLAALVYGLTIFTIQQSHFFTVDSFANFFSLGSIVATLFFLENKKSRYLVQAAVFFGLAMACKINSLSLLPFLGAIIIFSSSGKLLERLKQITFWFASFGLFSYLALRLSDPRFFQSDNIFNPTINHQFLSNLQSLMAVSQPTASYPPSVQWLSSTPVLTPLRDLITFGLGPFFFIFFIIGVIIIGRLIYKNIRSARGKQSVELILIGVFMSGLFLYQAVQFGKTMRYFYFLYPFSALFIAVGIKSLISRSRFVTAVLLLGAAVWTISFMTIYSRPHSRVTASQWIYSNIPAGRVIAVEHWDDALPLMITGYNRSYQFVELPVFAPDTEEKWQIMNDSLSKADYYILSSNRGYGSIGKVADRFPKMSQYYVDLFAERTDFELEAEFNSYPSLCLPIVNLCLPFNDQWIDEAFSVYDHPRVLIFKKKPL